MCLTRSNKEDVGRPGKQAAPSAAGAAWTCTLGCYLLLRQRAACGLLFLLLPLLVQQRESS